MFIYVINKLMSIFQNKSDFIIIKQIVTFKTMYNYSISKLLIYFSIRLSRNAKIRYLVNNKFLSTFFS